MEIENYWTYIKKKGGRNIGNLENGDKVRLCDGTNVVITNNRDLDKIKGRNFDTNILREFGKSNINYIHNSISRPPLYRQ